MTKNGSLVVLRVALGLFILVWGGDKIFNSGHTIGVSDRFYFGLVSAPLLVTVAGIAQIVLAGLLIVGKFKKVAYTVLLLMVTGTLLAVWKSVLDPLGLYMEGGNIVFFSSVVIWAAAYYLWTTRNDDSTA